MSGFLRSFDKLISQSQLAKSGHKLLLRSTNTTLHPTAYYYKKTLNSSRLGHELDVFQLGITSAALTRQALNYSQLLSHVEQQAIRSEIEERISSNMNDINTHFGEILSLLRIGQTDFPIQTVADISFVLAFGPVKVQNANAIITEHLIPTIREKLQYASIHNLRDILSALVKLNYSGDKELFKNLITALSKKDSPSQLQTVTNHSWNVDQYESSDSKCACNIISCGNSNFEKYISEGGSTSTLAKAKFTLCELWDQATYNYINPLFFREKRINHRFESRNIENENESFSSTLERLSEIVPESSQAISEIKSKL